MTEQKTSKVFWRRLYYFFPFQLVILHLRSNQLLLLFWFLLWGFITGKIASKYGVPYLFLSPEYLGSVDFWSFAITGFSLGGFIMAFNITTYIIHGTKFPFLATLSRPFYKYCINNSIIPIVFTGIYLIKLCSFQLHIEFTPVSELLIELCGFILGMGLFFVASIWYFKRTNKDVFKISGMTEDELEFMNQSTQRGENIDTTFIKSPKWYQVFNRRPSWTVVTYISHFPFRINLTRESKHYDKELLRRVFAQNHINASIFEVVLIVSFILLGAFREIRAFEIPAAASVFLLFTMLIMIFSALYSWLKGWTTTFFIVGIIGFNALSSNYDFLTENHAYGLDYSVAPAAYVMDEISIQASAANMDADYHAMLAQLEAWKERNTVDGELPKLVLLTVSGGGLRSSLWTYRTLQTLDSTLNRPIMDQAFMITGASGGMIGAGYYREVYLRQQLGEDHDPAAPIHLENISSDILNPALFAIATNDVFIRYQTFDYGGYTYVKDRGYAFEKRLNENTMNLMDRPFSEYATYEDNGTIPFMIFSPTVINDGRRLLISNRPVSFLTTKQTHKIGAAPLIEDIEFMRLFEDHDADNLRFLTAVRMSATFPYVLPIVTLPTEPEIEVMDAGLRDNYGIKSTLQFLYTFRDWITENTSGVVIVQTRDRQKDFTEASEISSWFERITSPVGTLYNNFTRIHDFEHDRLLQQVNGWLETDLDVCTFSLHHDRNENISLSFHLTALEKKRILGSMDMPSNQNSLMRVQDLLN